MRYVVTGGNGFIGSHVVDQLLTTGKEVVVIDKITNQKNAYSKQVRHVARQLFMDMSDPNLMEKAIQKDDVIVHLAAQSHVDVSFNNPVETTISNVVGAHSLLAASVKCGVSKVIIMSTDEVYGSTDRLIDENCLKPANPYSASKAAADMIANAYKGMYKELPIITLRSNNIAGPRQFIRNIIPRFSVLGLLGRHFTLHGDGSARRRYLWVGDAVDAICTLALRGSQSKTYHIGTEEAFSNLEIAEKIGGYLELQDYISYETDRLVNDSIYPSDSRDMQQDFGWQVTRKLDDFLPETIEWYRENLDDFTHYFQP